MKTGIAGLDTAFQAVFKKGNGPRIAVFAEYDALKGLGHACGHNLIATSALGCAAAVKQVLESSELEGSMEHLPRKMAEERSSCLSRVYLTVWMLFS